MDAPGPAGGPHAAGAGPATIAAFTALRIARGVLPLVWALDFLSCNLPVIGFANYSHFLTLSTLNPVGLP